MTMENLMPCLWFDTQGQEAADFYISVFPNSRIVDANPLTVIFELDGKRFMALNGGPSTRASPRRSRSS
jgi:Uncharacterized protein conserved in bacteria